MKYKLIAPVNREYSTVEQILENRGIARYDAAAYLNTTDKDINSPLAFGKDILDIGAKMLITHISAGDNILVVCDSDCDGFTSSALLINYLYSCFPSFVDNHLTYFIHSGKQHGLSDCIEEALEYKMIILPDSSSNDFAYHQRLKENNIDVLVLDHHEAEYISENACIINNQLSDYPNKELSGVGVTWQFCRYLDTLMGKDNANEYLDLVALGLMADMMSLRSVETKHLILKGFREEHLKNPFIVGMSEKNAYSLGNKITPMGAAFYIAPFVNAMVRSGTQEEKDLLFRSMLNHKAYEKVLSNKRGHKAGEMESVLAQSLRTCTNVKNRQTRAQDKGLELLEGMIESENLLENKVLLFLLEPDQIPAEVRGLIANKFMAKYQRPCCILTRVEEEDDSVVLLSHPPKPQVKVSYQGSARGYDKSGVTNFKDICAETGFTMYTAGHQGAFGIGIKEDEIQNYIAATNEALKDMSSEPCYSVDYIYKGEDVNPTNIIDIANLDNLWGKDMEEPYVAIENLKVTKDMLTLMSPDKKPTLKISLPNNVCLIKFGSSQEEYEFFLSEMGYKEFNIIGRCNKNEWNGHITPQIFIEDYEKIDESKYIF